MDTATLPSRVRHQLQIVRGVGVDIPEDAKILDLGCGGGATVRALRAAGYDAWGCDIKLRDTADATALASDGYIKHIPMHPYRIPFEDGEFDLILSDQVLEHVMDYEDFVAESHRVQKTGGFSLHLFPGRWRPFEGHLYVPLASIHRSYPWLLLWAVLGIRNEYQVGQGFREVAAFNWTWLRKQTNYLSTPTIRRLFQRKFGWVDFREDLFLSNSESPRGRLVHRLITALPALVRVYRTLWSRVLIVQRTT